MNFATAIVRYRWIVLALVVAMAVTLSLLPINRSESVNEKPSYLPADSPYLKIVDDLSRTFPDSAYMSQAVVAFERTDGPLTPRDLAAVEATAAKIAQPSPFSGTAELDKVRIRSPRDFAAPPGLKLLGETPPPNPLISTTNHGQAALIIVSIPYNFLTTRSADLVRHIRAVADGNTVLPPGLAVAVTGASGIGYDYTQAAKDSHDKTLWITLTAILLILLFVYRAPMAALVPLVAIMLAGVVTTNLLQLLQPLGVHIGTAEKIFVVVLLYGAGTDYSLLFISRYREYLDLGLQPNHAIASGLAGTMPAILASAGTNTLGLLTLSFAQYGLFRTTGPAVAIALVIALLTAVTLTPALTAIVGKTMFWPRTPHRTLPGGKILPPIRYTMWPRIAGLVIRHPVIIFTTVMLLLIAPAIESFRGVWVYDTMTAMPSKAIDKVGNSAQGVEMVKRHWPVGEIAPLAVLIKSQEKLTPDRWRSLALNLTQGLAKLPAVKDVRSLVSPLGNVYAVPENGLVGLFVREKALGQYVSADGTAMQLAVIMKYPSLSLEAMDAAKDIQAEASRLVQAQTPPATAAITGATIEMIETRKVTHSDFLLVAALTLAVIWCIVFILLLDVPLSLFMVASTVLSYIATVGISQWMFVGLLGEPGLDWKVQIFLFVVMVAVGQDYNIFLASRLAQEARKLPLRHAIEQAVTHTGPVISSCGLIMTATLGSLAAGELGLLKQLGLAFATGMLIDTFVVRPLMLPAFVMLTRRTGRSWGLH